MTHPPSAKQCSSLLHSLREGPQLIAEVEQLARNHGIKERTLRRAREAMEIETVREGFGTPGRWKLRPGNEMVSLLEELESRAFAKELSRPKRLRIDRSG